MEQQITITMSQQTVNQLARSGYILYGFKAVQGSKSGVPLVWFQAKDYLMHTRVGWFNQYQGYASTSPIVPNQQIHVSFCVDMYLGHSLIINQPNGGGGVTTSGFPTGITIKDEISSQFTCGISEQHDEPPTPSSVSFTPTCAFPLHGDEKIVIVPLDKVLLFFSTEQLLTSAVVLESYSPGIFIDMNNAPLRTVRYDINTGWSTDPANQSWAQLVPPHSQLTPLLIQN